MPKVPVANLIPGQVLQSDVYDRNGRMIIPKETTLKDNHLKALKTWGIQTVTIYGDEQEDDTDVYDVPDKIQNEIEKDLAKRFSQTDLMHPFIQELYKICYEHALIKASKNRGHV